MTSPTTCERWLRCATNKIAMPSWLFGPISDNSWISQRDGCPIKKSLAKSRQRRKSVASTSSLHSSDRAAKRSSDFCHVRSSTSIAKEINGSQGRHRHESVKDKQCYEPRLMWSCQRLFAFAALFRIQIAKHSQAKQRDSPCTTTT